MGKMLTLESSVTYTEVQLEKGKPDEEGYYDVTFGGLNVVNSAGEFYPMTSEVKKLFAESSTLQTKVKEGQLRAEWGHPKYDGLSTKQRTVRALTIDEKSTCGHIKEVSVADTPTRISGQPQPVYLITGKIRPEGPFGPSLKSTLENANSNTSFSIRAFFKQIEPANGMVQKPLGHIVTWDFVNSPGIPFATKSHWVTHEEDLTPEIDDSNLTMEAKCAYNDLIKDISAPENKPRAFDMF